MTPTQLTGYELPPQWREHDHKSHVVQFYAEDGFLLDTLARYIGAALVTGDAALVIATPEHREGLTRRLRARGLDTAVAAGQSRFLLLDAAATLDRFMVGGMPDPRRFVASVGNEVARARAAAGGGPARVAAFGEMVALLWAEGNGDAALQLEALWNQLAESHAFSLHCAYPLGSFGRADHSEFFHSVCAAHTGVLPSDNYIRLDGDDARLRHVASLEQRGQALANEVAELRATQEALRRRDQVVATLLSWENKAKRED